MFLVQYKLFKSCKLNEKGKQIYDQNSYSGVSRGVEIHV